MIRFFFVDKTFIFYFLFLLFLFILSSTEDVIGGEISYVGDSNYHTYHALGTDEK